MQRLCSSIPVQLRFHSWLYILRPGHYTDRWDNGTEFVLHLMNKSFGSCPVQNTLRENKRSHLDSAKDEVCVKLETPPGTTVLSLHRIGT